MIARWQTRLGHDHAQHCIVSCRDVRTQHVCADFVSCTSAHCAHRLWSSQGPGCGRHREKAPKRRQEPSYDSKKWTQPYTPSPPWTPADRVDENPKAPSDCHFRHWRACAPWQSRPLPRCLHFCRSGGVVHELTVTTRIDRVTVHELPARSVPALDTTTLEYSTNSGVFTPEFAQPGPRSGGCEAHPAAMERQPCRCAP